MFLIHFFFEKGDFEKKKYKELIILELALTGMEITFQRNSSKVPSDTHPKSIDHCLQIEKKEEISFRLFSPTLDPLVFLYPSFLE